MTILDRYLIQRLSAIVAFAILVFTMCWIAPETLFRAIQGVAQGSLTLDQAAAYLLFKIPEVLIYCLPISMFIGTVFLMRQLSLSSELVAMMSSGISFKRIVRPIAIVGFVVSIGFFLTQEMLVPLAAKQLRELNQVTHFEHRAFDYPQVTFVEHGKSGQMRKFLIISPWAKGEQNQFIFLFYKGQQDNTHIQKIITASQGRWLENVNRWVLYHGVEYTLNPRGIYKSVKTFEQKQVSTSPVPYGLLSFPSGNPAEFQLKQLDKYVRLLTHGEQTEDAQFYRVRLWQRYTLIWVPLLFAVLGAIIGIERSRARRNMGLTYTGAVLLLYNIMVPSSTTLGSIGVLPAPIAALVPILVATGLGLGVMKLRQLEG